jgi:hypothetical protein
MKPFQRKDSTKINHHLSTLTLKPARNPTENQIGDDQDEAPYRIPCPPPLFLSILHNCTTHSGTIFHTG